MGTRAVITFKDEHESFSVYQHWDGHPATVTENIIASLEFAWPLPRFEADEFAAAYVRASKSGQGNIRFTKGAKYHPDLAFNYVVTVKNGNLNIAAFEGNGKVKVQSCQSTR